MRTARAQNIRCLTEVATHAAAGRQTQTAVPRVCQNCSFCLHDETNPAAPLNGPLGPPMRRLCIRGGLHGGERRSCTASQPNSKPRSCGIRCSPPGCSALAELTFPRSCANSGARSCLFLCNYLFFFLFACHLSAVPNWLHSCRAPPAKMGGRDINCQNLRTPEYPDHDIPFRRDVPQKIQDKSGCSRAPLRVTNFFRLTRNLAVTSGKRSGCKIA